MAEHEAGRRADVGMTGLSRAIMKSRTSAALAGWSASAPVCWVPMTASCPSPGRS